MSTKVNEKLNLPHNLYLYWIKVAYKDDFPNSLTSLMGMARGFNSDGTLKTQMTEQKC